jgi:hypothetical protein
MVCSGGGETVQTVFRTYRSFSDTQLKQGVNEKSLAKSCDCQTVKSPGGE